MGLHSHKGPLTTCHWNGQRRTKFFDRDSIKHLVDHTVQDTLLLAFCIKVIVFGGFWGCAGWMLMVYQDTGD